MDAASPRPVSETRSAREALGEGASRCPFHRATVAPDTVEPPAPSRPAKVKLTAPPPSGQAVGQGAAIARGVAAGMGSPLSTVALAESLGVQFRAPGWFGTGPRPVSADKAVKLASARRPLDVQVDGQWRPVKDLDTLSGVLDAQERQVTQEMLANVVQQVGEQVSEAATRCPFLAALRQPAALPSVALSSAAGTLARHRGNPVYALQELHARHGRAFTVDLPTVGHVQFDDRPEVLKAALMNTDNGTGDFVKSSVMGRGVSTLIGQQNIFLSGGPDWKTVKDTLRPALGYAVVRSDAMVDRLSDIVDRHLDDIAQEAENSGTGEAVVDLHHTMQSAALDVAMQVLFGASLSKAELAHLQDAFATQTGWLEAETANPTHVSLSKVPGFSRLAEAYRTLDSTAARLIANRRASGQDKDDLLGALLRVRDPQSGQPLDDERLRHEVICLMEAGHETTGSLMSWALTMLASHPQDYRELQAEVDQKAGQSRCTMQQMAELKSVERVVSESLRMYPPFYLFTRETTRDVSVQTPSGPTNIPSGTMLVSNLYTAQRDERTWGVRSTGFPANEFHPARWAGETPSTPLNFGGGPHLCLGFLLGKLETNVMLARFAQRFELSPAHPALDTIPDRPTMDADLSLHPRNSVVSVRLRPTGDKG